MRVTQGLKNAGEDASPHTWGDRAKTAMPPTCPLAWMMFPPLTVSSVSLMISTMAIAR